jgi:creatinine amidohydrolase
VSEGKAYELASLSYPQVDAILASEGTKVAIIPAGSTEAHGPHLPLNTDSIISEEMARRGAEALAERGYLAVRFPTIHYAVTDWAGDFAGSTSIPEDAALGVVLGACLAARRMGFDRVVLTNAHLEPDNVRTLREVAKRYEAETGQALLFPDVVRRRNAERLTEEFRSGSCHAGQYETSLVLAVRPELVDGDAAAALPDHFVPLAERIAAGAKSFLECGMDQAYCGNPAGASAEEGEATYAVLAQMVVDVVEGAV